MVSDYKAEMKRVIDALITNHEFDGKMVLSFGHCNSTEEMLNYLSERGITVAAILDNNESKQGGHYNNIKIVSPQFIKKIPNSKVIVLVATRFFEAMSAQLRELGYSGEVIKVVDYNSFAEYSLSEDTIKRKTERMLRGAQTLIKIREQFPQQHLVICPNRALGDVYWACAYLPAYCTKEKLKSTVVIVLGNGCRQVAEMFGIANVMTLEGTEMDELVQTIIFNHEENCIIAHHDRPYTDNIIKYLDKHLLTFIDYYKYAVFCLGKGAMPVKPLKLAEVNNKSQLTENKSVIIAPYAKSVVQAAPEFWNKIVGDYREHGFQVFTNVFGDEAPLAHTIPISLPLNQLIGAVEYAGHFVGLRSGLCDIVSTADCHKTVVMPDCIYSTTSNKIADFFALPNWEQIIL